MKKLLLSISAIAVGTVALAQCTDLFISEYVEGWSNNKAIEIYNPTANVIDLNGYDLVRFRNQDATPSNPVQLQGMLQPYDVYIVVLDKRDTAGTGFEAPVWDSLQAKADTFANPVYNNGAEAMYFNGNDPMAILSGGGSTIVDLFGVISDLANQDGWGFYGTDTAGNSLYMTKDHTLERKAGVQSGITVPPTSFDPLVEWDTLWANYFTGLGAHISTCDPTDIEEPFEGRKSKLWVYPSPSADGYIRVRTNNNIERIELYNTIGQKILTKSYIRIRTNRLSLHLEDVNPGAYFVNVTFENGDKVTKQIILSK